MNAGDFRKLALALPEVEEKEHMGHPDFRVGGKIFATLGPNEAWGMVKLTPEQQAERLASNPESFERVSGAWGTGGATLVRWPAARKPAVQQALLAAWRNVAPKKLAERMNLD